MVSTPTSYSGTPGLEFGRALGDLKLVLGHVTQFLMVINFRALPSEGK
jgi:hypothetical protein